MCLAGCGRSDEKLAQPSERAVQRAWSPRWSPDGKRIACLVADSHGKAFVHVTDSSLSMPETLVGEWAVSPDREPQTSRISLSAPEGLVWSPDGVSLLIPGVEWFEFDDKDRLPGSGLWRLSMRGGKPQPAGVHPESYEDELYSYRSPTWSSDGSRLAWVGVDTDGQASIVTRNTRVAADAASARVEPAADSDWPCYSPVAAKLAFIRRILRGPTSSPAYQVRIAEPGMPNGRTLWTWAASGQAADPGNDRDVSRAGRYGPALQGLCWSPTGKRLALSVLENESRDAAGRIWLIDEHEGGRPTPLTTAREGDLRAPTWIDDHHIGAVRRTPSGHELVSVKISTGRVQKLIGLPSTDFDWSPDRKRIVVALQKEAGPTGHGGLQVLSTGL